MFFYVDTILPTIDQNQFAYQRGKSTVDAIICAIDKLTRSLDESHTKYVTSVFLDMSKAFDKMDRGKLMIMLAERGVCANLLGIIHSFLYNRHQSVRIDKACSDNQHVGNGTPQGTLLGPMFWLLYVDTLQLPHDMIKYADDLTLIAHPTKHLENPQSLQPAIDDIAKWCSDHNMVANAKKSATVHFTNKYARSDTSTAPPVTLNGEHIPTQRQTKFLGLTIDNNLTFSQHINMVGEKIRPLTYVLTNLKRSGLPKDLLVRFYTGCIRPKMTYGCPAWYPMLSSTSKEQLLSLEKLALKIISPALGDYQDRISALELTPLDDYIDQQCRKYIDKIKWPDHCLHKLLPKCQTESRRSARLKPRAVTTCRTELRRNTLLLSYANQDIISYKE